MINRRKIEKLNYMSLEKKMKNIGILISFVLCILLVGFQPVLSSENKIEGENILSQKQKSEIKQLLHDDITETEARSLDIKLRIGIQESGAVKLKGFSNDGKYFAYTLPSRTLPKRETKTTPLIVRDVETLQIKHQIELSNSWVASMAWSPDDKSMIYSDGRGDLHIVRLQEAKEIAIPRMERTVNRDKPIVWYDEFTVFASRSGGKKIMKIDLETLTTEWADQDNLKFLTPNNTHPLCTFKRKPNFAISTKDGSFKRNIDIGGKTKPTVSGQLFVRPDLHVAIYVGGGRSITKIRIVYFGQVEPNESLFKVRLSDEHLAAEVLQKIKSAHKEGRTIYAIVYEPLVNPLTDRVVGFDKSKQKGVVRIIDWSDNALTFETAIVGDKTIRENDIVTQFFEKGSRRPIYFNEDLWNILESVT